MLYRYYFHNFIPKTRFSKIPLFELCVDNRRVRSAVSFNTSIENIKWKPFEIWFFRVSWILNVLLEWCGVHRTCQCSSVCGNIRNRFLPWCNHFMAYCYWAAYELFWGLRNPNYYYCVLQNFKQTIDKRFILSKNLKLSQYWRMMWRFSWKLRNTVLTRFTVLPWRKHYVSEPLLLLYERLWWQKHMVLHHS